MSDVVTQPLAIIEPRFEATRTPNRVPIRRDRAVAVPKSISVFSSFPVVIMSWSTGWPVWKESPNWKVIMLTKYVANRFCIGYGTQLPLTKRSEEHTSELQSLTNL